MSEHTGTRKLIRLILRRDRILLPVWVLLMGLWPVSLTSSFKDLYPTAADQQEFFAESANLASYKALVGPPFGSNIGALGAQRSTTVLLFVALASLLTIIRHTRAEEETGRRELLAATPIGRLSPVTAILAVTLAADLVLGGIVTLGLLGLDLPAAGAVALGLELALAGWVFAALGALVAQLSASARIARGIGIGVLALAFLLRLAGDAGESDSGLSWLSWLTPLGWLHRVRAFADERWWLFLPAIALAVVLAAGAYALAVRRDLGAGLLQPRSGPAAASPALRSPLALAWRLQRGTLIAWLVGFTIGGIIIGSLANDAASSAGDSQQVQDILARVGGNGALAESFLAALTSVVGVITATVAVQAAIRPRAEETGHRAEPVLAASVSRSRWASSHLVFSLLGPAAVLACYGLACGLTYGSSGGDVSDRLGDVLIGAIVQLPAVWVVASITVLLFGLLPRLTALTWAVPILCLIFGQFGAIFELNQWLLDLSPFTHIPRLPGGDVTMIPLVTLSAIAAVLAAAGLAGFRRRDIPVG